MSDGGVAGVVMAAGSSTRMGQNKLLLTVGAPPEAIVRRAARAALAAGLAPVVVVLGHQAAEVRRAVEDLPCRFVVNAAYVDGKGTSLQAGIAEVQAATSAGAAVVMLADMPLVTAEMVAAVAARGRASGAPMVVSRYGEAEGGVAAPPILYTRPLFEELLGLPARACGKEMVRRHAHEAEVLRWPEAALADVDVPEDLARIRAALAGAAGDGEAPPR